MSKEMMEMLEGAIISSLDLKHYDHSCFKRKVNSAPWLEKWPGFKDFFRNVIETRAIPYERYNELADDRFENDDDLYDFLMALYLYSYDEGPEDAIYESMRRAGELIDDPDGADQPEMMEMLEGAIISNLALSYYDHSGFKRDITSVRWQGKWRGFKDFFRNVIETRAIPYETYSDLADDYFENDDDLYDFLTALYLYVYDEGPEDAINEVMRRTGHLNDAPETTDQPEQSPG
ncbi:hypothetical protein ACFQPI_16465 [Insolitispirillum peregrinum]|uniref:hypothetical protein n=1 Tax=Insolitispirillum peregrinum TaxID=80876 RepID=UPI003608BE31